MKGSQADARAYALKLLSYRARSRKELTERLASKGFESARIEETLEFLEKSGLVNDEALASDLLHYATETKPLGKKGIRTLLSRRGIDKKIADGVIASHTRGMEEKAARDFVQRKLRTLSGRPEHIIRRKLWGMLQRRGFPADIIAKTLKDVQS